MLHKGLVFLVSGALYKDLYEAYIQRVLDLCDFWDWEKFA